MTSEQLNKIAATGFVIATSTIVAFAVAGSIEGIRKDRMARKAYKGLVDMTDQANSVFTNAKFDRIIKENDL